MWGVGSGGGRDEGGVCGVGMGQTPADRAEPPFRVPMSPRQT